MIFILIYTKGLIINMILLIENKTNFVWDIWIDVAKWYY